MTWLSVWIYDFLVGSEDLKTALYFLIRCNRWNNALLWIHEFIMQFHIDDLKMLVKIKIVSAPHEWNALRNKFLFLN